MANNAFSTPWLVFRKGDKIPKGSIAAHPGAAFIVYFFKIRGEYDPVINLIKAAPDLLKACKDALERLEYVVSTQPDFIGYGPRYESIRMLKAAIAKAEGKEAQDG